MSSPKLAAAKNATRPTTETAPRETAELYRLLVDSVEDYAIFALDAEGRILSWNSGAQQLKGYTADEAIGQHFSMFYPPDRVAIGFPDFELREAARVGRFEDEGWRIRKDGSRFWANVVITALHDPDGTLVGFAKVTRDLSERRITEEELRTSEERFRLIVQGVRDYAIFMLDPTGHVSTWNEGAENIKGYSSTEIIGKHFSIFYTAEDLETGKPARELATAEASGVYEEEGWRVRKNGSRIWANVVITALRNADGVLIGFAKVTRDLTERRAAQEQAIADARRVAVEESARQNAESTRERAERLLSIAGALSAAHTLPDIVRVVLDPGFTAAEVAAGTLDLLDDSGTTVRLVGERGFPNLPHWLRAVGIDDDVPKSAAVREEVTVIVRSKSERDARFPRVSEVLESLGAVVAIPLTARGKVIGALTMHRLESHPLTDEALQFMHLLAFQTAQALERVMLYEAELAARIKADDANRAKSEFLAAMSHELRTPLNAIGGYAELIDMGVRGPVTQQQHDDLRRITASQQHLLSIINDILNFSRIDAGKIDFHFAHIQVADILDFVAHMIEPQASAKGLTLVVDDCPPHLAVWADKPKVDQILLNLLSNAVKFTSAGEVRLSCRSDNERRVTIDVSDSGMGIAPDQIDRIFEPFVQVGRSLTNTREGAGLGLAISRELARGMHGDITAESTIGVGSIFRLTLPVSSGSAAV